MLYKITMKEYKWNELIKKDASPGNSDLVLATVPVEGIYVYKDVDFFEDGIKYTQKCWVIEIPAQTYVQVGGGHIPNIVRLASASNNIK